MKANSQRVMECMMRRLKEVGFEDLDALTAEYYPEVKKRLPWNENTYRTVLGYLGKYNEQKKLAESFRDYLPTEVETGIIRSELGSFGIILTVFGMRFSEVWDMCYGDRPGTVVFRPGKGGKPLVVNLGELKPEVQQALDEWMDLTKRPTVKQIRTRWYKLRDQGLISKDCIPHSFRHRMATRMLNDGVPIDAVKNLMGHRRRESTERYYSSSPTMTANLYSTYCQY